MADTLKTIFVRPVDRAIEGVIKADDQASLRVELDEYVITNEIEQRLETFFEAYSNYENANGVWISGFFGSGKSHLLKMLAFLLENRKVDGDPAFEIFAPKVQHNSILAADLKRAIAIPSQSILFNIDQKADVISKTDVDALLGVFQKVFDEACGYYGKSAHIAQFERDLDKKGHYQSFQQAYLVASGKPWVLGREEVLFEGENVAKAVAEASGISQADATGIIDRYRSDYKSSIEDFADRVRNYIDQRGSTFRLNFFVDEVGQYIADNVKLMTNLQTIAESLNTKCKGRAWIIVTAQQEIVSVIGDLNARQQNDFSKIQARFQKRVPLSSQDVAEVIQKRLLAKNEAGINLLSDLYHKESGNLKALFDFSDGSRRFENFRDRDHFINSFPFVPYQYPLFQLAIMGLSEHNAFEGKHSSVGERSMLGVFQEVAKKLADQDIGTIATFDQMFEGIKTALKSSAQTSILIAEKNLGDDFALRVLKALFLVKYAKEFKATSRNLVVLLQDRFDLDLGELRRKVEHALSLLEQNTYIQRNGDTFEYLTNEEKDVEQEIKAVDVDNGEIAKELSRILFDQTIKLRRIKHDASSQEFSFAQRLDGVLQGRDYELAIDLITPFAAAEIKDEALAMQTLSSDHLAVLLPQDERFRADLVAWKRTDKYVRQNLSSASDRVRGIIGDKGLQNGHRMRDLEARAKSLLGEARMWVRGSEVEIRSEDPGVRIAKGFQTLVDKVHTNLPMLRGQSYSEVDVLRLFKHGAQTLQGLGETAPSEPERELLNILATQNRQGLRTTVKTLLDRLNQKPYGWSEFTILALTAGLVGRGKLEVALDGAPLDGEAVPKALNNNHKHANIVLEQTSDHTPAQVSRLRSSIEALMDRSAEARDAKGLVKEAGEVLNSLLAETDGLLRDVDRYPFLDALTPIKAEIATLKQIPQNTWVTELPSKAEALADLKEDVLDPIRRFMAGEQRRIYDEAARFLREKAALIGGLDQSQVTALQQALADPQAHKSGVASSIKPNLDGLKQAIEQAATAARESARAQLLGLREALENLPEWPAVPDGEKAAILASFDQATKPILEQDVPDVIAGSLARFSDGLFNRLLEQAALSGTPVAPMSPPEPRPATPAGPDAGPGSGVAKPPVPPAEMAPKVPQFVGIASLSPQPRSPILSNVEDIEGYVGELRQNLMNAIAEGKRIKL